LIVIAAQRTRKQAKNTKKKGNTLLNSWWKQGLKKGLFVPV